MSNNFIIFLQNYLIQSKAVSRILSRAIIYLGSASRRTSSDLPGNQAERAAPFPCAVLLRTGFAVLPPLPTERWALTSPFHPWPAMAGRYVFCGTFRGLAPPSCYEASCPVEFGLSSCASGARDRRPYFGFEKSAL